MFHVFGLSLEGQIIVAVITMSWILSITMIALREFLISLYPVQICNSQAKNAIIDYTSMHHQKES